MIKTDIVLTVLITGNKTIFENVAMGRYFLRPNSRSPKEVWLRVGPQHGQSLVGAVEDQIKKDEEVYVVHFETHINDEGYSEVHSENCSNRCPSQTIMTQDAQTEQKELNINTVNVIMLQGVVVERLKSWRDTQENIPLAQATFAEWARSISSEPIATDEMEAILDTGTFEQRIGRNEFRAVIITHSTE